jgi:dolichol-phosphate mannosyltransferase
MKALFFAPVYNQIRELPEILNDIAAARLPAVEFLFVNNGSSDGSEDLVHASGHAWIDVPRNRGVGYSYMLALDWALARDHAIFGTIAANGKMLPAEIPRLVDPIRAGQADYVTGSRFLTGGGYPNLPRFRRLSIPLVNAWVAVVHGARLTDATCGFRAFRLEIMRRARFDWHAEWLHTYSFEYYLYAKVLLDRRLQTLEVPITMRYPAAGTYSKIRPGRDWVAMLRPWLIARLEGEGFGP